jgi:hypothetical protein
LAGFIALLGGFALLAADPKTVKLADNVEITVPQPVNLQFPNGTVWKGTLLEITKTYIRFQLMRDGAVAVKYKIEDIKAIGAITDDDVFFFDPKKKDWDSVRTRARIDEENKKKTTPFDTKPKPAAAGDRICMVAEGSGRDEAKAIADAETDAATRAIYSVLDGITALQKQKEIEEKVIPGCGVLAKGRSRILSGQRKTGENQVTVRIGAVLDRKEIVERLAKAGIKVPDKPRGVTSLPEREVIRRDPAGYLHAVLADYIGTLRAEAILGEKDDDAYMTHARVEVDMPAQELALANLLTVLEAIKRPANGKWETPVGLSRVTDNVPHYRSEEWTGKLSKLAFDDAKQWDVWVLSKHRDDWASTTWQQYIIDADLERSLAGLLGRLGVEVFLLGVDGSVLGYAVLPCDEVKGEGWKWALVHSKNPADNRNHLFVSPDTLHASNLVSARTLNIKLKQIVTKQIQVGPLPLGQRVVGAQARLLQLD